MQVKYNIEKKVETKHSPVSTIIIKFSTLNSQLSILEYYLPIE